MRRWLPLLWLAACQPAREVPGLSGERPAAPALSVRPTRSHHVSFTVSGSAEPGTRVRLFTNAACDGLALLEVSPEALAAGVTVGAVPSSFNVIAARALSALGTPSECSERVVFEQLGLSPVPPLLLDLSPPSPSPVGTPLLTGRAADGTRVRLYQGKACLGAPMQEVSPAQLERGVTVVASRNTVTYWSGEAVESEGSSSACVTVSYFHDDLPPKPPVLSPPLPPTPSSEPYVVLNLACELSDSVALYARPGCQESPVVARCSRDVWSRAEPDAVTQYSARAVDQAGNASRCVEVFTYVHDSALPPWLGEVTARRGWDDETRVDVSVSAQSNAEVLVFDGPACESPALGTALPGNYFSFTFSRAVDAGVGVWTSVFARTDTLGSACKAAYVPPLDGGP